MNASAILIAAKSDGLRFEISPSGTLKTAGNNDAVQKWLPTIRQHKAEILEVLRQPTNGIEPLSDHDEAHILDWLSRIGETDPVTIGEVIDRCRSDQEARTYFTGRANET